MTQTAISPEAKQKRDIEAFMRHIQRQRAAMTEIGSMIANTANRISMRTHEKAPADPIKKARRKSQRRARAITRRNGK